MKHIKKFKELASKGALAAIMATGLAGCNSGGGEQANTAVVKQNATVFIEKTDRGYKIADEFPSNETRVFLREKDAEGNMNERLLSQAEIDKLLKAARESGKIVVFVSNEVGSGIVPNTPVGREYRDLAGWVNQRVANACDSVFLCVAGQAVDVKKLAFKFED